MDSAYGIQAVTEPRSPWPCPPGPPLRRGRRFGASIFACGLDRSAARESIVRVVAGERQKNALVEVSDNRRDLGGLRNVGHHS